MLLLMSLITSLGSTSASAQPVSTRIIGPDVTGEPLVLPAVNGQGFAHLVKLAGVAGGFEGILPTQNEAWITATGKSLGEVLDAMVAADPRYQWREDDGVIVFRPIESWHQADSLLHAPIGGFSLENIDAGDVLALVAQMVGVKPVYHTVDTRRFSVTVREGATWLEALNAIARAHGVLTWVIKPTEPPSAPFPLTLMINIGGHGRGIVIPAGAVLHSTVSEPHDRRGAASGEPSILDRIVGQNPDRSEIVLYALYGAVRQLTAAVRVPFGFQLLPVHEGVVTAQGDRITLTGLRLREALDALVAFDPRYRWHELNGVIVFGPVATRSDTQEPLLRIVPSVHLKDVPVAHAIDAVFAALGVPGRSSYPDTRPISISLPKGPLFHLLNEISRQHGEMSWEWAEIPPEDKAIYNREFRYQLTFSQPDGGGIGFAVP